MLLASNRGPNFEKEKDETVAALKSINSQLSIAGALSLEDLGRAAEAGFRTIVNFRPDGESPNQTPSGAARQTAERLGLAYIHIPSTKHELFTDAVVDAAQAAFSRSVGPILAHCAGGQRAAIVWAASEARNQKPVIEILDELSAVGFDFAFLRDDLDAQADRPRWTQALESAIRTPGTDAILLDATASQKVAA
ncbi:MAG: TIGR01244 family sulfur transferase [Hyphomicrobium sp.]